MEMKKLVVVILAITIISPVVLAEKTEKGGKVTIYVMKNGNVIKRSKEISVDEARKIMEKLNRAVHAYQPYVNGREIKLTEEEKERIDKIFRDAFLELQKAGLIDGVDTQWIIPHFAISLFTPIMSCGNGITWIPWYPGEAFMGFMFRPIFVHYFNGYTACMNFHLIPPRMEYWDWTGRQTFMILGFAGMYIDFSKMGCGIPPMQFLMGGSFLISGIDWPS